MICLGNFFAHLEQMFGNVEQGANFCTYVHMYVRTSFPPKSEVEGLWLSVWVPGPVVGVPVPELGVPEPK